MDDASRYPLLDISTLNPKMDVTLVTDAGGLSLLAEFINSTQDKVLGTDTETNMTDDFYFRKVRTVQVGNKEKQFVVDLLAFAGSEDVLRNSQGFYGKNNAEIYKPIFDVLAPVLCSNDWIKCGANISFDYETLYWNFGVQMCGMFSVDLAERVIQAGAISLKKYAEFSLAALIERYFEKSIDKSSQQSFDLCTPLTPTQVAYAALDTRLPLAVRAVQVRVLERDQLLTVVNIENEAIATFIDMHLNGQRLDTERWMLRLEAVLRNRVEELKFLDDVFIPVVGHKLHQIDEDELVRLERVWKNDFESATPLEKELAAQKRLEKDRVKRESIAQKLKDAVNRRKAAKAAARTAFSELSKKKTEVKNNLVKCEGEAYVNYGSGPQLIETLNKFKGIKLESSSDDALLEYNDLPFIQILRKYKKGKKDTGTYGAQWTRRWITKPCKEEGWLHPWDGKLHGLYHQIDTETGRSSSSQPNCQNLPKEDEVRACFIADPPDEIEPGGYDIITIDMEGAELRIIAELTNSTTWINAFNLGQDVHSVSTEILEPVKWPAATLPGCAYYALGEDGRPRKLKCKCPGHVELRGKTKAVNFLLAYGGGPDALADQLGITSDAAKELMYKHEQAFPDIWRYLNDSGRRAKARGEARDMYGRRRLLPAPTEQSATDWFIAECDERLELDEEVCERNIFNFKAKELRKPTKEEHWKLTHRPVSARDVHYAIRALQGSQERRGKNHEAQGTNATMIKRAMGSGYDKNGKPFLWHILKQYNAKLVSMIHDELVIQAPKRVSKQVAEEARDAFRRAGSEIFRFIQMTSDYHIAERWQK